MSRTETAIKTTVIALMLIFFILGGVAGWFLQKYTQANNAQLQRAIKIEPATDILTSQLIRTIMIYGVVKKIDGNNLDLAYGGDEKTVGIASGAQVFSSIPQKDPKTGNFITGTPKQISFSDIKVGDGVSVTLDLLANGQFQGNLVYIFTSPQ